MVLLNICNTLFDAERGEWPIYQRKKWVPRYSHSCRQQIWRSFRCPLSSKWFSPARPFSLNTSVTVTADEIHNTQDHLLHLRGQAHSPFKLLLYFPLIHSVLYSYCQSCLDISDSLLSPEDNLLLATSRTLWPTDRWAWRYERLTDLLGKCFSCISLSLCRVSISHQMTGLSLWESEINLAH